MGEAVQAVHMQVQAQRRMLPLRSTAGATEQKSMRMGCTMPACWAGEPGLLPGELKKCSAFEGARAPLCVPSTRIDAGLLPRLRRKVPI
jgi:hypothetical protein